MSHELSVLKIISCLSHDHKLVKITYHSKKHGGNLVTRVIEPYSAKFMGKGEKRAMHLYGWDTGEGNDTVGIHLFKVADIASAHQIGRTFLPRFHVAL